MIKLKSTLNESTNVNVISRKINSLRYLDFILYRGTYKKFNDIAKFSPRQKRNPKDTDAEVDSFVEVYRQEFYPDKPSRRSSVFAINDEYAASDYGEPQYIFFPKNAKIFYNKEYKDSVRMTARVATGLVYFLRSITYAENSYPQETSKLLKKNKDFANLMQFSKELFNKMNESGQYKFDSIYSEYGIKNLIENFKRLSQLPEKIGLINDVKLGAERAMVSIETINSYFDNLKELKGRKNIKYKDYEIEFIVQCPYYYLVGQNYQITPHNGKYLVEKYYV